MVSTDERVCFGCGTPLVRGRETCRSCGRQSKRQYQPTASEFNAAQQSEYLAGTVKWFSDEKGFGFITTEDGTDVFVHHTGLTGEGYRTLSEGTPVLLRVEVRDRGLSAVDVGRGSRPADTEAPRPDELAGDGAVHSEQILILDDDGQVQWIPCRRGPAGHVIVERDALWSVLTDASLPETDRTKVAAWKASAEFEGLINDPATPEAALQEFFEAHPGFLLGDAYDALFPQVVFPVGVDGSAYRPDFVLRPVAGVTYEPAIVELKLPSQPVVKAVRGHKALYSQVHDAVAQLKSYARAFEEAGHRDWFAQELGFSAYRPTLALVVGRADNLPNVRATAIARADIAPVSLSTYDDVLARYRRRSGLS